MKKLVRDFIPNFLTPQDGYTIEYADPQDMSKLLMEKLQEEILELQAALDSKDSNQIKDELVDMLEVLYALRDLSNIDPFGLSYLQSNKKLLKGGFTRGVVISK